MASDLLTVVIPVRNRAGIVRRTLDSVASQRQLPRLIVVDNGSTDATAEVVAGWVASHSSEEFPVELLVEPEPGACAARNRGLERVTTPFVMFFDSDDVMLPAHVERVAEAISTHPEIDIFGWDVELVELGGARRRLPFADRDMMFRNIFNAVMATQRYAVRTSLVRAVGGWNNDVAGWNDYELGVRLIAADPQTLRLDGDVTVNVISQAESITGTSYSCGRQKWEGALDECRRVLDSAGHEEALRWLTLKETVLAALYAREGSIELAKKLMHKVLSRPMSKWQRAQLRLAFAYTRIGGRGIHHLLRWL